MVAVPRGNDKKRKKLLSAALDLICLLQHRSRPIETLSIARFLDEIGDNPVEFLLAMQRDVLVWRSSLMGRECQCDVWSSLRLRCKLVRLSTTNQKTGICGQ
jgi:hypothetical protein